MARPDLHVRVEGVGHDAYRKSTVAGWVKKLSEELSRLAPEASDCLQQRLPDRGAGGTTFGELRLLPPPGGFQFADGVA